MNAIELIDSFSEFKEILAEELVNKIEPISKEIKKLLEDKKYLDETYKQVSEIENYNGKVWEYIEGWTCERFLANCIERNNLKKFHLISKPNYKKLLEHIFNSRVIDCSYKNIMVEGVCHYHFENQTITLI